MTTLPVCRQTITHARTHTPTPTHTHIHTHPHPHPLSLTHAQHTLSPATRYKRIKVLKEQKWYKNKSVNRIKAFKVCMCSKNCFNATPALRSQSLLHCVAVWCIVVQCGAVWYSVVQYAAVCSSMLQCVAVWCSVLQCVAVCCSVVQCCAVW